MIMSYRVIVDVDVLFVASATTKWSECQYCTNILRTMSGGQEYTSHYLQGLWPVSSTSAMLEPTLCERCVR